MILETNSSNVVQTRYLLGNGNLISQTVASTTSYFLPDVQGSTRALTNASGAIISGQTFDYSAFGDLVSTGTPNTDYLYTGQQFDTSTGLYSLRARYYDPGVGRFNSRDTWAYNFQNPMEFNRYVYAAGNPVRWSDPSGHSALAELSNAYKNILKQASVAAVNLGPRAALFYARASLWVMRLLPRLGGATCLFVSFTSNAELGGGCDIPIDELIDAGRSFIRVLQDVAGSGNRFSEAADLVRVVANQLPDPALGRPGPSNFAIAELSVNGSSRGWTWGVSGKRPEVGAIEGVIADLTEVNGIIDNIASAPGTSFSTIPGADIHSEAKVLEDIITNSLNDVPLGSRIGLTLYTERAPCPSCGGDVGTGGVIGEFYDRLTSMGYIVQIDVLWTTPLNPKK